MGNYIHGLRYHETYVSIFNLLFDVAYELSGFVVVGTLACQYGMWSLMRWNGSCENGRGFARVLV